MSSKCETCIHWKPQHSSILGECTRMISLNDPDEAIELAVGVNQKKGFAYAAAAVITEYNFCCIQHTLALGKAICHHIKEDENGG